MKKIIIGLFALSILSNTSKAQNTEGRALPSADLKTVEGKTVNSSKFTNDGKPIIISFWATWCKPCKKELDAISENFEEWQKETGVKLIAISIDDSRSSGKVGTDAKSHAWDYEIYIDQNQDFKRAMNVNNVPHTFIINGKGEIVWQHNSYAEGDEDHLYEALKKIAKGEKVEE
ncbi:MAG: TlpA disulfide reductase family protein [Bacteroidota bacterium]|nr:TlpA disulfide reductase family protein [Bacteroidota bacterium]